MDKCLNTAEATKLQMQAMANQNNESSDANALKSSSDKSNARMVDDCKFCGTKKIEKSVLLTVKSACKKCKKENRVSSKCQLHEKKTSSKKNKPRDPKSGSKETSRKKVSLVETDLSSEKEILSVELSTEDDNVSTSEVINSVTDFPNKIYAVMKIQGATRETCTNADWLWSIVQCSFKEMSSRSCRDPQNKQATDSLQQAANLSTWNDKSELA